MKKTIIIVSSIVLLLGVNFASAMKVLPPLAIAEPLNAFENQIWNDIQILQNQISNLAQRLAVLERKPQPVSVVDANGVVRGQFLDGSPDGNVKFWDTTYNRTINLNIYTQGLIEKYDGIIANKLYFDQENCQGNSYNEGVIYPTEIRKFSDNGDAHPNGWEYVKTESLETYGNGTMRSLWENGHCSAANPASPYRYSLVLEATPMMFNGPLTIQD